MPGTATKSPRTHFAALLLALTCLVASEPVFGQDDISNERMRRMELIMRGNALCASGDMAGCRDTLKAAVNNAGRYFTGAYAPVLDKARENLNRAESALKADGKTASPGPEKSKQPQEKTKPAKEKSPGRGLGAEIAREEKCMKVYDEAYDYYDAKNYAKAIATYLEVLRACPEMCGAMNNLGIVYSAMDDARNALAWFEKAYACNPSDPSHAANVTNMRRYVGQGK